MGRNSKSEEARTGVDRWNATEAPKAKKQVKKRAYKRRDMVAEEE